MRRITDYIPLITLTGLAFAASCGGNNGNGFGGNDASDTGTTTNDATDEFMFGMNEGGDGPACTQCSGDLHSVLTCGNNPQVVQTCTGDLGCGPGGCIDACTAAAASQSSIGCDYYSIPPDAWTHGSCFAAFVTNNWSSPMTVSLVWKGTTIDATPYSYLPQGKGTSITYQAIPTSGIPANSMAIVFMDQLASSDSYYVGCPSSVKTAITTEDVAAKGTSIGNALEILTSVPATVYDIYPYGGALSYMPSATLLLPTTAWDTNFVATTMSETPATTPGIDFVAQQDGTTITLLPTTNITAGTGVAAATANTPVTYSINKGQTVHIMQAPDGTGKDLSGSIVQSNYPIGVWGEHFCLTQSASPPNWRMVGAVKGTTLTYDPAVAGAPTTLDEGQLVEFAGPGAFHVVSQDNMHPFYLAAHRPGGDCDAAHQEIPPIPSLGNEYVAIANEATNYDIGGPETVNVVPPAQYLSSYIFFTDPTYAYTDLALVRVLASDNTFKDVTLDCITGPVTGWQPVGTSGKFEYVHVDVQSGGAAVGACNNGLHTISSTGLLGITVWGYDEAASYAYPAGASVKPINTVVVPPIPN
jgi:hypothetical protein